MLWMMGVPVVSMQVIHVVHDDAHVRPALRGLQNIHGRPRFELAETHLDQDLVELRVPEVAGARMAVQGP